MREDFIVLSIKKRYVVNEKNEPVEVILDLRTFEKIQELVEDHLLAQALATASQEKKLTIKEAKRHYDRLRKPR